MTISLSLTQIESYLRKRKKPKPDQTPPHHPCLTQDPEIFQKGEDCWWKPRSQAPWTISLCWSLKGGVHFPLINTALGASFPQNEEEETFWGFSQALKKTPKCSTAGFDHPVPLTETIAHLQHQNYAARYHYSTRHSLVKSWYVLLKEKLKERLSSWQIQKRRNTTASLISSCFICTLIHLGAICP